MGVPIAAFKCFICFSILLPITIHCSIFADSLKRLVNRADILSGTIFTSSQTTGNYEYILLKNISSVNVTEIFIPTIVMNRPENETPGDSSSQSTESTTSIKYEQPATSSSDEVEDPSMNENEFGYEVECGVRRGSSGDRRSRIVGGSEVIKGEYPWMVSVQLSSDQLPRHICGGSVLSSYWVVTAAHCVHNIPPSSLTVVAGDHDLYNIEGDEQRVKVVKILTTGYQRYSFGRDIALLQVRPQMFMDGVTVAPICIPKLGYEFKPGDEGVVAGWGRLSEDGSLPEILRHVTLPLVDKARCDSNYSRAGYFRYLHACQLCTSTDNRMDSCQGDSGGPLICRVESRSDDENAIDKSAEDGRYFLCGVVSWGVGCARPRYPSVYTKVACYSDWIYRVLYNIRPF